MGKIINILGPHGVGKTTLQNYIKDNDLGLVFEGFILPVEGLNLSNSEEYLKYEKKYIEKINIQNETIKKSEKDGYVIRSIEEMGFFLDKRNIDTSEFEKIYNENIKSDYLIYLDAEKSTLDNRINHDEVRDMTETETWYSNDYDDYDRYFKARKNILVINTDTLKPEQVYKKIQELIKA